LVSSTFYKDLLESKSQPRLQKDFADAAFTGLARRFARFLPRPHTTPADKLVSALVVKPGSTTPLLAGLFTSDLSYVEARLPAVHFRSAVRFYLNLPPLRTHFGRIVTRDCGCTLEACLNPSCSKPDEALDPFGDHVVSTSLGPLGPGGDP